MIGNNKERSSIGQIDELLVEITSVIRKFTDGYNLVPPYANSQQPKRIELRSTPSMVSTDYGELARQFYAQRRSRDAALGLDHLLGEPAWDILLDLTAAYESGKKLTITAVAVGSGAPLTTALRYIGVMEKQGLIERIPDDEDGRRTWIKLTKLGIQKMRMALDAMRSN